MIAPTDELVRHEAACVAVVLEHKVGFHICSTQPTAPLGRGYIYVDVPDKADTGRVKCLLESWYRDEARQVFQERLDACFPSVERFGVAYPELEVRVMKSRWGSTGPAGKIRLNLKLIQVPKTYIRYVVFHELCHFL